MRKLTLILVALLALAIPSHAMSDKEVLTQVTKLYTQGMSETDIAKQLIQQGVTIDQLQRVQQQAKQMMKGGNTSAQQPAANKNNFGRKNNGEQRLVDSLRINKTNKEWVMNPDGEWVMMDKPVVRNRQVFGRDIFRKDNVNFEPNMNVATPKTYVLGPGDEVIIDVYGASQEQFTQTITPDGKVTIDGYGPISLGGLDILGATRRLRTTLGSRYQGCQISLSVGQTRSISVNIMGEVERPGMYQLSAFANVFNALYMAGGITDAGTLRQIRVYRENQEVGKVDLYGYLMDGKTDGNIRLEDGDVILVGAYQELVQIQGKVKRPMFYEMVQGETMDRLVSFAGGFAGDAHTASLRVNRKMGSLSVHTVRNADFAKFALADGDSVTVDSVLQRLQNTVEIQGAVFRPGFYGIGEQLKTVKQLVEAADGITEDALTTRAVLYRMKVDRTLQAVPFDLADVLSGKSEDIQLKNEDQIFVASIAERNENQYVVIHGEVFTPDTFTFAEHESVEDLILRAGGLTERASTAKVDVSRRIIDTHATEESQIKTKLFTIELKDSLALNENGFQLEPFDEVYVRMSPAYGKQMNVSVRGEILFEGTYSMRTQDDRLSDLVKAAGGLSSHAYAQGARLLRTMTEEEMARRDQLIKMSKTASAKDSIDLDKLDISTTYYVGIDLQEAIKYPGSNEDIILREGDVLIIPSQNSTVKINGEVLFPNTVSYIKGKKPRYYVDQAGGYSNSARRWRAYIIYANGKVSPARKGKVQPGCEIVVPSKPTRQPANAAQWVSIASASASMASVVATIVAVFKK